MHAIEPINEQLSTTQKRTELYHVPVGITSLDHKLEGGVVPGTLNVVCALTGEGKSSLMIHIAQTAAALGHPVVIFHSEMDSQRDYLPRLTSWITGTPYSQNPRHESQHDYLTLINLVDLRKHLGQELNVIRKHIHDLKTRQNQTPVIIVDSIDGIGGDRIQLDQLAQYLTNLAESEDVIVWTTSQANDGARESKTVKVEHLRDSRGKAFPCSLFIGLRKCGESEEDGNAVLTIDKNRQGKRFQLRCRVHFESQRFSDVDDFYQLP